MLSSTLLVCVCTFALVFGQANFAPFGSALGDTLAPQSDDGYFGPVPFDFSFYGTEQTSLYVDNNGIITFGNGLSTYTPVGMSGAYFPAIAPFWADVYTYCGGQVWYGSRSDAATMATLQAENSLSWTPTHAFVATWSNVGYYYQCDKADSFQAVLIGDATGNSLVCFHYGTMQWTTGDASGGYEGLGGTPASVGFSAGDGQRYVQTSASLTGAVLNTQDFCTQVDQGVIVLPPAPPAQTCGNNIIEGSEQCDGGACCSSQCTLLSSGSPCGTSSGPCDVAATCDGSSSTCPANTAASSSVVCRPAVNSCDVPESCDGTTNVCPADQLSMTPSCFCGRQNFVGGEYAINFFCNADQSGFFECLQGPWAVLSTEMNCAAGTSCGCFDGQECSCGGAETPCVWAGTVQSCPAGTGY